LGSKLEQPKGTVQRGLTNLPGVIQWLVSRQLAYADDELEDDEEFSHGHPLAGVSGDPMHEGHFKYDIASSNRLSLEEPQSIAFNGRLNKPADTCYSWWGAASLEVLLNTLSIQKIYDRVEADIPRCSGKGDLSTEN